MIPHNFLCLLVFTFKLVSAIPRDLSSSSEDSSLNVTGLQRTDSSQYDHGYIGGDLLRRTVDNSSCAQLTVADLQQFPGFAAMTAKVKQQLGNGSYNLVTNPPEYPAQGAVICAQTAPVKVDLSTNYTCANSMQSATGSMMNTNGSMRLIFQQGFTNTGTWAITTGTSVAQGISLSAVFSIPDLSSSSVSVSTAATIINDNTNQFATSVTSTQTQELWLNIPSNATCTGYLNVTSCTSGGKAQVMYTGMGTAWFNFDSVTGPPNATKSNMHYKWGFSIESLLPNPSDRSVWLSATGDMRSNSSSHYYGVCT